MIIMGKDDVDVYTAMKQMVDQQMRGVHTTSPAIVEEVDLDEQRVTVTLKEDEEVFIGDVPIATTFARNGEGIVYPVAKDDEGLLMHTRESLYNKQGERGHKDTEVSRHHTLESAVFFPMYWFDEDEKPEYGEGQLRIQMNDGLPTEDPEQALDVRFDPFEREIEIVMFDESGEPVINFVLDGNTGKVRINSAEVVTEDGEMNDTFLGLGGGVQESGQ